MNLHEATYQTHQYRQTASRTSRRQLRLQRPVYEVAVPVSAVHALHRRWTPGCPVPADNAVCCTSGLEQCLQHTASVSETTAEAKSQIKVIVRLLLQCIFLFCFLAVLDPRVGHTMNTLSHKLCQHLN